MCIRDSLKPDPKSGMTVNEALQNRRSWREYAPEALSLEELSGVMWAAGGINRPQDGRLTAPSALALYPIRIYAFFPEGVYRYDAKGQKLVRVTEGDHRNLAGAQPFVFTAPLNLAYVADMSVYEGKNIPAGHVRYLCGQDAAGYAENVNPVSYTHLGARPHGYGCRIHYGRRLFVSDAHAGGYRPRQTPNPHHPCR